MVWNALNELINAVVDGDRIRKLGLSNFNNKALKINSITIGLRPCTQESASGGLKIVHGKSTVENPTIIQEKNEATAVGVDLNAGRREKSEGGESKSNCVEMKWVLFNNGNPERKPTFQK